MNQLPQIGFLGFSLIMFVAGLGIPVFAAFNTTLSQQLGGPVAATAATFCVGAFVSLSLLAFTGFPAREAFSFARPWIWFGAIFVIAYAIAIAFAAPHIGIGNAIFFVLFGQLVAAATIDHFGWFGVPVSPLTLQRVAGVAIMALGLYLARKPL